MDGVQELLLAQLAGESPPMGTSALSDVLAHSAGDNPMTASILDALRRREQRRALEDGEAWGAAGADDPVDGRPDPAVADVLQRLYDEVKALRQRNLLLADALGACPRCWGDDPGCPVCRGRGSPGGRMPVGALFTAIVEPALRRRGATLVPPPPARPRHAAVPTVAPGPVPQPEPATPA